MGVKRQIRLRIRRERGKKRRTEDEELLAAEEELAEVVVAEVVVLWPGVMKTGVKIGPS